MITLKELNPKGFALSKEQEANLEILLERLNKIRAKYGKPMLITSGVRDLEDHKRIYREKANKLGITNIRIPMGSQHLKAAAADVLDLHGELMKWCRDNESFLEEIGLWIEDDPSVPRVHFQIYPPASKKRFFKP